jgi:hypothetical protein
MFLKLCSNSLQNPIRSVLVGQIRGFGPGLPSISAFHGGLCVVKLFSFVWRLLIHSGVVELVDWAVLCEFGAT